MPHIELRYAGGEVRRFETAPFETVYQAAARAGAPVLTDCLEGACATCKAFCLSGDYGLIDPGLDALSEDEERAGQVLLCQMEAESDCTISLPYSLSFASGCPPRTFGCELTELAPVAPDIFRLVALAPEPVDFVPGQYARVTIPGGAERAYSFANRPGERVLEFYIRRIPGGLMGSYLEGPARVGDSLAIVAPLGGFYLRPGAGEAVLVAGGTGMAPFLSMLRSLAAPSLTPISSSHPRTGSPSRPSSGLPAARAFRILHGARRPEEWFASETIGELARAMSAARIEAAFACDSLAGTGTSSRTSSGANTGPNAGANTGPNAGYPIIQGPVTELLDVECAAPRGTDFYLCGPPGMIQASERRLAELGVPDARVFSERFNPA